MISSKVISKCHLRICSRFLVIIYRFFQSRKRYLIRRKWMFMKQPQKFSFLFNMFVLNGELKILSQSRREKTSGKFALTKAVSCLPTTLSYIICAQGNCFVYNVTHMIYWHILWILIVFIIFDISCFCFCWYKIACDTFCFEYLVH